MMPPRAMDGGQIISSSGAGPLQPRKQPRKEVKAQQNTRFRTSASINPLTAQFTLLRLLYVSVTGPPRLGRTLRR